MLKRKLATIRRVGRERGPLALLDTALKKAFPSGNPWLSWNARVLLACPVQTVSDAGRGEALSGDEALALAREEGAGRAARAALRRGETCWAIREEGGIRARVWIGGPWRRIQSDTGYLLRGGNDRARWWWRDVWVRPDCRGRGLAHALFRSWGASLPPGEHCLYTEVDPGNPPSFKAHQRMGFREIARLKMLCVLGLRIYWCRGAGQPRLSLRFLPRNLYLSSN